MACGGTIRSTFCNLTIISRLLYVFVALQRTTPEEIGNEVYEICFYVVPSALVMIRGILRRKTLAMLYGV